MWTAVRPVWPSASSCRTRCPPMNPPAPVTTILIELNLTAPAFAKTALAPPPQADYLSLCDFAGLHPRPLRRATRGARPAHARRTPGTARARRAVACERGLDDRP